MTHTSLSDCSQGSLQRLHEIAHRNGWDEIKDDAREAFMQGHAYVGPSEGD